MPGPHNRDRSVGSSSEGLDAGVYEYDPRRDSLGVAPKMSAAEKRYLLPYFKLFIYED